MSRVNPIIGQICPICGLSGMKCCPPDTCVWGQSSVACVKGGALTTVPPPWQGLVSPYTVALAANQAAQRRWLGRYGMSPTLHPQQQQALMVQAQTNPCSYPDYERAQRKQRIDNVGNPAARTRDVVWTARGRRRNPEACCDACADADGDPNHRCPCGPAPNP